MNWLKSLCLTGILAAGLVPLSSAAAGSYSYRQYYSGWQQAPARSYYYRTYYYKPTPTYVGYKYHYVIYYPSRPQYVYYYNPYKGTYWGRYPTAACEKGQYSMLAEEDRKARLEDIPEKAFPKPGAMPRVPEAEDNIKVDAPPDDLPTREGLPK